MCILTLCVVTSCLAATNPAQASALLTEPPVSPVESEWRFVDALAAPMTWHPRWTREAAANDEVSLKQGVKIEKGFPDADGSLDTAYADLHEFFKCVGLSEGGPFRIVTERAPMPKFETFKVIVSETECRIQANDTEGIRRGIFFVEDELMRADGPFLKVGETLRSPFIHTRISRCFFGPIKRPPKNRDELLDDVDYYPDGYLNRLAHDGVNGLWLTIEFKDLCKTSLIAECSPDRERRLEKLRKTVAKCGRYGIKVFLFCIEPVAMDPGNPLLKAHPELGGGTMGASTKLFCPFSEAAQTYLREAMHDIFSQVPGLGGLIDITFGERPTTCLSGAEVDWQLNCPTCSKKQPWEILTASLSAMERGMHEAAPDAKFISWLYVPESGTGTEYASLNPFSEIARHTPPGVIVQYNFESGGRKLQLGKERPAGDYWLSYVGPSDPFKSVASAVSEAAAAGANVGMSAKIQACCSHEVATAPYIPVPSLLYRKYDAMRTLGVTSVMQCWYFGNMPSLMNRAAATELPFALETVSEDEFLLNLARRDWGKVHAEQVVQAWRLFAEAYDNYPLTNAFQFYGPMQDGVVWPLHLKPVHLPLAPTWKLEYPPSGDRIGESFCGWHTYAEVLELCRSMSDTWKRGLEVLAALKPQYADDPERLRDISVAEALGIQFRSGYNILRFYDFREQLLYGPKEKKTAILQEMRSIVEEEMKNSSDIAVLCDSNPFLGFHAEAEGYKYFPAKLQWRVDLLRQLLDTEFVEAGQAVEEGKDVFAAFSGMEDGPLVYRCKPAPEGFASAWRTNAAWQPVVEVALSPDDPGGSWQAAHDAGALYLNVECAPSEMWRPLSATAYIESAHIYPRRTFQIDADGKRNTRLGWLCPEAEWEAETAVEEGKRTFRFRIPFDAFCGEFDPTRPMRLNVQVQSASSDGSGRLVQTWAPLASKAPMYRLGYGGENASEMGWLRIEK